MILSRVKPKLLSLRHATVLVCDRCLGELEIFEFTNDIVTDEKIIHNKPDIDLIEEFRKEHEKCEEAFVNSLL